MFVREESARVMHITPRREGRFVRAMGNHGLSVALFCYVLLWLTHAHEGHGPHAAHVAHVAKQHRKKTPEVHVLTQFAAAKTAIHQKCAQLEKLMNRERAVEHILEQQEEKFKHVQELSEEEKLNAVGALRVHRRQLEKSSSLVDDALQILTLMLNNITYLDFGHMKDTSEKMNKILAESAADAEDISNKIDALGAQNKVILDVKGKSNATRTGMDDVVNFLLRDITGSVDQLQDQIHGHETKTFEREKHTEGSQLETVVRIDPTESHGANSTSKSHKHHGGKGHEGIVTTLIDTKNNQYTLRRPTDTTLHYEDISLMNDVILVLIMAFVGGSICSFIGMPTFFGCVPQGWGLASAQAQDRWIPGQPGVCGRGPGGPAPHNHHNPPPMEEQKRWGQDSGLADLQEKIDTASGGEE